MDKIIVVSDIPTIRQAVREATGLANLSVEEASSGPQALAMIADDPPDLAILDMQIGSMGGIAICLEMRLEESYGHLPHIPVLMLLDRRADVFLTRRVHAEGWILKPLEPIRIKKAAETVLDGRTFYDHRFTPVPTLTPAYSPLVSAEGL
ncbi:MAG: response regulator [Actinobacteria bacterium]|jgi:DNA-binding response OmpR family regulator|nr:response regulator [Actinomycetota bacterium]MCL5886056.1 response regulator [Actinomycetota bacterium]